jgi:Tol biopolymer transport system component
MAAFISYSREDSGFAVRLVKDLKKTKYDIWFDQFDIPKGSRWDVEIQLALENCSAFLIILSPDSVQSQNVMDEVNYAIDENKQILPIKIKECHVPFRLRRFQYVDCVDQSYDECLNEIKDFLGTTNGEKIELDKRLKELESQAIQNELRGDFWNALQSWYEIKRIDPSFPRVEIKIKELETELRREKEKRERESARKAAREKAERNAAKKAACQARWLAFTQKINTILNTTKKKITSLKLERKTLMITAAIALTTIVALIVFMWIISPPLFFSGSSGGEVNIYSYAGKDITQITQTSSGAKNWSSSSGLGWNIYFTSNRSGKAEIYGFNRNTGDLWQATDTPGTAESWFPAIGVDGNLYFTSNRTGKAEIYNFNTRTGKLWQITTTPGTAESWSPAISVDGTLYFTSDRTGKAEIYHFNTNTGKLLQITDTPGTAESWSPAIGFNGVLYFTSDRTRKAEIYKFNTYTSKLEQMTATPGQAESWSPVVLGKNIYITSDRTGQSRVYRINHLDVAITNFESWTKKIDERIPGY